MSDRFNLVICLAGKGSRFRNEGYKTPKYLLTTPNGIILSEIMDNLVSTGTTDIYLVLNNREKQYVEYIEQRVMSYSANVKIILTDDTRGQAHTALIACQQILNEYPVFIFNGDTILKGRNFDVMLDYLNNGGASGVIDCFHSSAPHFSYVLIDQNNNISTIKEKQVISDKATTGLYGFRSARLYEKYYTSTCFDREEYISEVYTNMLVDSCVLKAYISEDLSKTIILGTPKEYEQWLNI